MNTHLYNYRENCWLFWEDSGVSSTGAGMHVWLVLSWLVTEHDNNLQKWKAKLASSLWLLIRCCKREMPKVRNGQQIRCHQRQLHFTMSKLGCSPVQRVERQVEHGEGNQWGVDKKTLVGFIWTSECGGWTSHARCKGVGINYIVLLHEPLGERQCAPITPTVHGMHNVFLTCIGLYVDGSRPMCTMHTMYLAHVALIFSFYFLTIGLIEIKITGEKLRDCYLLFHRWFQKLENCHYSTFSVKNELIPQTTSIDIE